MNTRQNVLFRCDGDAQLGLGHVYRCLASAEQLREGHGWGVSFAMATGPIGFDLIRQTGYPIEHKPDDDDEDNWLDNVIQSIRPDALVLDVRSELARSSVEKWRSEGLLIVTLDDPSERRLAADLAFYPPVPQVERIDWAGFTGKLYVGWEWVILRKEFATTPCPKPQVPSPKPRAPKVLVTMGGSDPQGMTLKAVKALEMLDEDFEVVVVLGAGFQYKENLDNLMSTCKHRFDVRENVQNMAEIMAQSDLAVASFGVTAYELAAMGVPAIYLCLTEDHAKSASAFVEAGIGVCLGVFTHTSTDMLTEEVRQLLNDASRRSQMADRAGQHVDGRGVKRIARMIATRTEKTND